MTIESSVHLYFHSPCFDGAVSAALASDFLERVKGASSVTLHGVNYNLRKRWLTNALRRPCAVVDFLYHPDVDLWADHHPTAFLNSEVRRDYENRQNAEIFYDSQATSCAILLWQRWAPQIGEPGIRYEELVQWADKIDSARYASVEEAVMLKAPALKINLALGTSRDRMFSHRLVHLFRDKTLEEVAADPEVRKEYERGWQLQQRGMEKLRGAIELNKDGIAIFDMEANGLMLNRYAPFHFFPRARYSAGIVRVGGNAKVTSMRNPWMEFPSAPLGELCVPLGGGGHRRVGSILVNDRDPKPVLQALLGGISGWEHENRQRAASRVTA